MAAVNITQIKAAVENFGRGYYLCSDTDQSSQIYVGIGTTNYEYTHSWSTATARGHGLAWAQMVNDVNYWLVTNGYSSQVHAVGAVDIELSWSSVDLPGHGSMVMMRSIYMIIMILAPPKAARPGQIPIGLPAEMVGPGGRVV